MRYEKQPIKKQFISGGVFMMVLGFLTLLLIHPIGFWMVVVGALMSLAGLVADE